MDKYYKNVAKDWIVASILLLLVAGCVNHFHGGVRIIEKGVIIDNTCETKDSTDGTDR